MEIEFTSDSEYLGKICSYIKRNLIQLKQGTVVLTLTIDAVSFLSDLLCDESSRDSDVNDEMNITNYGMSLALKKIKKRNDTLKLQLLLGSVHSLCIQPPKEKNELPSGNISSFYKFVHNLHSLELDSVPLDQCMPIFGLKGTLNTLIIKNMPIGKIYNVLKDNSEGKDSIWPYLHTVECSHCHLHAIDKGLQLVPHLRRIVLQYNELIDAKPLSFNKELNYIDLSKNNISFPEFNVAFTQLTTLLIKENQIRSITGLKLLTSLKFIDLSNNRLMTWTDLIIFKSFAYLERINIKGNPLGQIDFNWLFVYLLKNQILSSGYIYVDILTLTQKDVKLIEGTLKKKAEFKKRIDQIIDNPSLNTMRLSELVLPAVPNTRFETPTNSVKATSPQPPKEQSNTVLSNSMSCEPLVTELVSRPVSREVKRASISNSYHSATGASSSSLTDSKERSNSTLSLSLARISSASLLEKKNSVEVPPFVSAGTLPPKKSDPVSFKTNSSTDVSMPSMKHRNSVQAMTSTSDSTPLLMSTEPSFATPSYTAPPPHELFRNNIQTPIYPSSILPDQFANEIFPLTPDIQALQLQPRLPTELDFDVCSSPVSIPPFPLHVRPQQPSPPATPSPKVTVPTLVPEKSSPVPTPTQIEEDDDSEVTVTPEDYQMLFTVEFYVSKRQQNDISPRLFIIYANELREYDGITGCFLELYNLDHLVSVRIIPDLKSFLEIDLKDQMLILEGSSSSTFELYLLLQARLYINGHSKINLTCCACQQTHYYSSNKPYVCVCGCPTLQLSQKKNELQLGDLIDYSVYRPKIISEYFHIPLSSRFIKEEDRALRVEEHLQQYLESYLLPVYHLIPTSKSILFLSSGSFFMTNPPLQTQERTVFLALTESSCLFLNNTSAWKTATFQDCPYIPALYCIDYYNIRTITMGLSAQYLTLSDTSSSTYYLFFYNERETQRYYEQLVAQLKDLCQHNQCECWWTLQDSQDILPLLQQVVPSTEAQPQYHIAFLNSPKTDVPKKVEAVSPSEMVPLSLIITPTTLYVCDEEFTSMNESRFSLRFTIELDTIQSITQDPDHKRVSLTFTTISIPYYKTYPLVIQSLSFEDLKAIVEQLQKA